MKIVYHVCAQFRKNLYDGVLEKKDPIKNYDDYQDLKVMMWEEMNLPNGSFPHEITITSLSILSTSEDE